MIVCTCMLHVHVVNYYNVVYSRL